MIMKRNHSNNKARATIEEEQAQEQEPLLLSYVKWIGDANSVYPVLSPGHAGKIWVMWCPLPGHAGRVRTFVVDLVTNQWLCTVCAVGGDVVDLAARLNRFGRKNAEHTIAIHRERMTRSEQQG